MELTSDAQGHSNFLEVQLAEGGLRAHHLSGRSQRDHGP